jgi:hypothetical protein
MSEGRTRETQAFVESKLRTVWQYDYDPHLEELHDLYERAKTQQWNVSTDLDWEREADPAEGVLLPDRVPMAPLPIWGRLDGRQRRALNREFSAFLISQAMHGEQGAMLLCGQLVDAVPDMEGKLYAATQVIDEARHVEVFHRYGKRVARVYPPSRPIKAIIDLLLTTDMWQKKCTGMQVIAESFALGAFRNIRANASDPLLREIVTLTARDEARHVAFGVIYVGDAVKRMAPAERAELEDFTAEALDAMVERRPGLAGGVLSEIFANAGLAPEDADRALREARDAPRGRPAGVVDPLRDLMVPNLERAGLISARVRPRYVEKGLLAA